ncbi:MAG TPA: hypothetical protein VFA20_06205 [Myxococcaceae bacterium]|nr:hypothetical protein [Myxococcaceae bacterium]
MPEDKGIGSKILGLFVESEGEAKPKDAGELSRFGLKTPPKSAAEEVAELARASGAPAAGTAAAPPPPPSSPSPEPPLKLAPASAPGAAVDFAAIFKDAGMDPAELDRVGQAEALLSKLPATIGQVEKRAIVEASLKAFGFEIEKIVTAAQNQKRALDAYVRVNETAAAKANQEAEAKIKSLTEQIAQLRADVEKRGAGLTQLTAKAQDRKVQVQKVLEFFSSPETPKT